MLGVPGAVKWLLLAGWWANAMPELGDPPSLLMLPTLLLLLPPPAAVESASRLPLRVPGLESADVKGVAQPEVDELVRRRTIRLTAWWDAKEPSTRMTPAGSSRPPDSLRWMARYAPASTLW